MPQMQKKSMRLAAVALMTVVMVSCRSPLVACNLPLIYGLNIVVTDSVTAASLVGGNTVVTVRDGAYVDEVRYYGDRYISAGGRPGVYSILVQRPGYRDWLRQNVRVSGTECGHPVPVTVAALLQPIP
jgi:hypothetical protein